MKAREIKEISFKEMTILPPAPGKCPECAVAHDPALPHNVNSLYYQMKFYQKHDRVPKWADAMEHCDDGVKEAWTKALLEHGVQVYGPDGRPI